MNAVVWMGPQAHWAAAFMASLFWGCIVVGFILGLAEAISHLFPRSLSQLIREVYEEELGRGSDESEE